MLITQFAESPTLLHSQDGNNIYKVFGNVILNPKSIKYCKQTFDSITFRVFPNKGQQCYSMQKFYFDIGFFLRLLYVVHIFLPGASGVWTALWAWKGGRDLRECWDESALLGGWQLLLHKECKLQASVQWEWFNPHHANQVCGHTVQPWLWYHRQQEHVDQGAQL